VPGVLSLRLISGAVARSIFDSEPGLDSVADGSMIGASRGTRS